MNANAEPITQVTPLYGVGDLGAALKVPHCYVTPLLNTGVFCHTHQWGSFRLFTQDRLDQIVREHGTLIRAASFLNSMNSQVNENLGGAESGHNEA